MKRLQKERAMLNKLEAWGCNTKEALERFVDDEDLYTMCINLFLEDGAFSALENAVATADYGAAFEAAHTLKGVAGNVSAGPLYDAIDVVVGKLRAETYAGLSLDVTKILGHRDSLKAIMA